jgi:hypothetical protein
MAYPKPLRHTYVLNENLSRRLNRLRLYAYDIRPYSSARDIIFYSIARDKASPRLLRNSDSAYHKKPAAYNFWRKNVKLYAADLRLAELKPGFARF